MENTNPAGSATGIDLAALPTYDPDRDTPGMMELRSQYKDGDYFKVEDVQAALARATPQHPDHLSNAEFLSKRLARVAKLAGVTMPDGTHEQIAEVAGTILGDIARRLETAATPQHSVTEQDERPAFDRWAIGEGFDVSRDTYGDYHSADLRRYWSGWQARAAQPLASTAATQPELASIKTWKQRLDQFGQIVEGGIVFPSLTDQAAARDAEIADLRAALAIPASTGEKA